MSERKEIAIEIKSNERGTVDVYIDGIKQPNVLSIEINVHPVGIGTTVTLEYLADTFSFSAPAELKQHHVVGSVFHRMRLLSRALKCAFTAKNA